MRIIAGAYKSRVIKIPEKLYKSGLKPTTSRTRETVFNIISSFFIKKDKSIPESSFLDLCSGSGIMGIEALSRGFSHSTFVDRNKEAVNLINSNTQFIEKVFFDVVSSDIMKLKALPKEQYDVIFLDPPYKNDDIKFMLKKIKIFLKNDGVLIIEFRKNFPIIFSEFYQKYIQKKQSSCQILALTLV